MSSDTLAFRARVLSPLSSGGELFLEDGLILVRNGLIEEVAPYDTTRRIRVPYRDLRPNVLVPGFVDAHLHFPQTRIIGSATGPLLPWLERTVFPEEARFRDRSYAIAVAKEFCARMIEAGTTTCAAFSSSSAEATDALFEVLLDVGMRAFVGLTLMDQSCPAAVKQDRKTAVRECEELIDKWHGRLGRLYFAITPRFALSCSRALMEDAARLAHAHDLLIQTHLAENEEEGKKTLEAHPYATSYLGVYAELGLLTRRTLLAHSIHLSDPEWDLMASRDAVPVHCPDSNFFLGSGRMQVRKAAQRGLRVPLGSDVAAGRTFDMRGVMARAYDNALCIGDALSPSALLRMATLEGARALGLDEEIGSIEPGKAFDAVEIRVPGYLAGEQAFYSHLVFADNARVERVFVRGECLFVRDLCLSTT